MTQPVDGVVRMFNPLLHQHCKLESWHIREQPLLLNRERGTLPPVYDQLNILTSYTINRLSHPPFLSFWFVTFCNTCIFFPALLPPLPQPFPLLYLDLRCLHCLYIHRWGPLYSGQNVCFKIFIRLVFELIHWEPTNTLPSSQALVQEPGNEAA